jgi:hypothetical protein
MRKHLLTSTLNADSHGFRLRDKRQILQGEGLGLIQDPE